LTIDPEQALRDANQKFTRRFNSIEDKLQQDGRVPSQSDLAEMDALWNVVKQEEIKP
jgi:ATP diphosphatase